jgi:hypothetical protein
MRRAAALLAVGLLVVTAGCAGAFSGSVSDEQLGQEPAEPYRWDAETDVYIDVTEDATFRAVYDVPTNRSTMELYRRDGFGGTNPIPVRAVRYRYPNGTEINGTQFDAHGGSIERTNDAVVVEFPHEGDEWDENATATFAFTSDSTPKRFSLPTFREGSYELVLPPNRSVDFFLFGNVIPRNHNRTVVDNRVHIRWDDVTSRSIVVQFYLERDLYVFGGLFGLFGVVAVAGLLYYRRQIEELRERREMVDVETDPDDEFRDEPPPGMG